MFLRQPHLILCVSAVAIITRAVFALSFTMTWVFAVNTGHGFEGQVIVLTTVESSYLEGKSRKS